MSKRPTDKQIIDGGGSVVYRGYALHVAEFDGRTGYYGKHANGYDAVGPFWNLTACKRAVDHSIRDEHETITVIRMLLDPTDREALDLIAQGTQDGNLAYLNFGSMPRLDRDLGILRPIAQPIARKLIGLGLVEIEHHRYIFNPNMQVTEATQKALEAIKR